MNHLRLYQCRSCEHATEQLGIKYCLKVNRALDTKTINYVGCASHSDFQNRNDDVILELREHVIKLYDDGFKDPMVTFDAAISMMKYGDTKLRPDKQESKL